MSRHGFLEGRVMVVSVEVQPYWCSSYFIHYPEEGMCLKVPLLSTSESHCFGHLMVMKTPEVMPILAKSVIT